MPRTVLMHLNVEVPDDDDRSVPDLVRAVEGAIEVGSDDEVMKGLACVLAEEVESTIVDSARPRATMTAQTPDEYLAVWFTPQAIRDVYGQEEDHTDPRRLWVEAASEEQLRRIGEECILSDPLWRLFRELIEHGIDCARLDEEHTS